MKKLIWRVIIIILISSFIIGGIFFLNNNKKNNNIQSISMSDDLDRLKQYFEEYSGIQIFLKSTSTVEQGNELANKLEDLKYLKNITFIPKENSYIELKNIVGDSADLSDVSNKIKAKCYYLDDISLLDENKYFEKIKNEIISIDTDNIIDNIITAGIIEIYNNEGMIAVEEYVKKCDMIENTQSKQNNSSNSPKDVSSKIIEGNVIHSGTIYKLDEKYIYYSDSDSRQLYFDKTLFSFINGRTCKAIELTDIKIGDYIKPEKEQILVFRNIIGDELNQELLYNFTLTNDERISFVNSVELEDIDITEDNKALVKINYGDIIGSELTNEKFSTLVEFNADTKYYSKGHNINGVNDLEMAKGNINSILLKKDTINKKKPAIVVLFESNDN